MKSRIVVVLYALLATLIVFNRGRWREQQVIRWDATGYYLYLPAFLLYHDPGQLAFYRHIDSLYAPSGSALQYGLHEHPQTGRRSTRYPAGVALFELPGFVAADWITRRFTAYPADGYSAPYQLAVALSTLLWSGLGLLLLRRFLLRYYADAVVWKVLLLLVLGTNFYYCTAFLQGWSHAYSFFLFAAGLFLTERWYRSGRPADIALLGLVLGVATLTRPTNVLIAAVPLLWPAAGPEGKGAFWRKQLPGLLAGGLFFGLALSVQLAYWKYATGHWLYYSYTDEGFDFLHPKIWKGLFSYRKGWWLYTPAALFFCLGLLPLYRQHRRLFWPLALFLLADVYIVFSWKIWHYGGGFSCRPMVEALAVLALPACALVQRLQAAGSRFAKGAAVVIGALLLALNVFQTYQFSLGILHFDRMTRAYYWRVFGRLHVPEEDRLLLRPASEDEPDG